MKEPQEGVYPSSLFLLPISFHLIWGFGRQLIGDACTYMSPFEVRPCDPLILKGRFSHFWGGSNLVLLPEGCGPQIIGIYLTHFLLSSKGRG